MAAFSSVESFSHQHLALCFLKKEKQLCCCFIDKIHNGAKDYECSEIKHCYTCVIV